MDTCKKIYDFDSFEPPVITQQMLESLAEQRKKEKYIFLFSCLSCIMNILFLIIASLAFLYNIYLGIVISGFYIYLLCSTSSITIFYYLKRRISYGRI